MTFTVAKPGPLVVQVDGPSRPLHLFVNPVEHARGNAHLVMERYKHKRPLMSRRTFSVGTEDDEAMWK